MSTQVIEGSESIGTLFSLLHDGIIVSYSSTGSSLRLSIEIEYLASTLSPSTTKLQLTLIAPEVLSFETWPRNAKAPPQMISDLSKIFRSRMEILEGDVSKGLVRVHCSVCSANGEFSGGVLSFHTERATVATEDGALLSLKDIQAAATQYWHQFDSE